MSTAPNDRGPSASQTAKTSRVLACVLCQQRKVKCDRKFPCANCLRSRVQCVPATLTPRRRRRKFPEREVLQRLREYEELLRQNNIKFDPFQKNPARDVEASNADDDVELEPEPSEDVREDSPSTAIKSETVYEAKSFWDALNYEEHKPEHNSDSSEDRMGDHLVRRAWDQFFENTDPLFGSRTTAVDLSTLHPEPVQIFRLWQIYLDNVNPLFKVTHTPTLQARIIEAAGSVQGIDPNLEALMFSIYSMAILSVSSVEFPGSFGLSKNDLLTRYQFGCQQALINCGFLRTGDRDCLTALFLYLVSVRRSTDPRSLSSLLGIAIRIAQRLRIHSEAACARRTTLEAEMRRRLWWALVLFDSRIGEMADHKTAMLNPTWDCRIPLNVNDFDLRPDMTELPTVQGQLTESLFVVVRGELGDFVRHAPFHLDFTCPALKLVAKDTHSSSVAGEDPLNNLAKMLEDRYFRCSDPGSPLHFITVWSARSYVAKTRLLQHIAKYSSRQVKQSEDERAVAVGHAITMLHCDTTLMRSPLSRGYHWFIHYHFPFPAYIHLIQDLKKRPLHARASEAWDAMSDNFEARGTSMYEENTPFFSTFARLVLQSWEAREAASSGEASVPPRLVSYLMRKMVRLNQAQSNADKGLPDQNIEPSTDDFSLAMLTDFDAHDLLYGMDGGNSRTEMEPWPNTIVPTQIPLDPGLSDLPNLEPSTQGAMKYCAW